MKCPACKGRGVRAYGREVEDGCDDCDATGQVPDVIARQCPGICPCLCPEGPCGHAWDGPVIALDGGLSQSVTCSHCGVPAMAHDVLVSQ